MRPKPYVIYWRLPTRRQRNSCATTRLTCLLPGSWSMPVSGRLSQSFLTVARRLTRRANRWQSGLRRSERGSTRIWRQAWKCSARPDKRARHHPYLGMPLVPVAAKKYAPVKRARQNGVTRRRETGILSGVGSARLLQLSPSRDVYDVCIIGSGAAGGAAAKVLTDRGLRVVMLEAGPMLDVAKHYTEHTWVYNLQHRGLGVGGSGYNSEGNRELDVAHIGRLPGEPYSNAPGS